MKLSNTPHVVHLYEIDLLRFLAAFAVMLYHYIFSSAGAESLHSFRIPELVPFAKYGYLGVQLFFMISGFVISNSVRASGLAQFVASRAARLYPAFWVCCTITFVVTYLCGGGEFVVSTRQFLVNLTMFSGFVRVPPIDAVYWTLFIEIHFYVLMSFILAFRMGDRLQMMVIVWLVAQGASKLLGLETIDRVLLGPHTPYFLGGILFSIVKQDGASRMRILLIILTWVWALMSAFDAIPFAEAQYHVAFSQWIVAGVLSVFFVVFLAISMGTNPIFLSPRVAVLGAVSYPLYLLHANVGIILLSKLSSVRHPEIVVSFTVAAMVVASWLVHRGVERVLQGPLARLIGVLIHRAGQILNALSN